MSCICSLSRAAAVEVWAWCLMPNHVHLILVPSDADGLRRALARVHRRYAGVIQARRKRSGHFWQGRFGAVVNEPIKWIRKEHRNSRCSTQNRNIVRGQTNSANTVVAIRPKRPNRLAPDLPGFFGPPIS